VPGGRAANVDDGSGPRAPVCDDTAAIVVALQRAAGVSMVGRVCGVSRRRRPANKLHGQQRRQVRAHAAAAITEVIAFC